jgi:hypothetical protein
MAGSVCLSRRTLGKNVATLSVSCGFRGECIGFTIAPQRPRCLPEDILDGTDLRARCRLVCTWCAVGETHSQAACMR